MHDIQDRINDLRRQQLIIDLLSVTIKNQHDLSEGYTNLRSREQVDLIINGASESSHMADEIRELIKRRDNRLS